MSKDEKLMVSKSKSKDLAEKILIWQGDITKLEIDAIVNAINSARLYSDGGIWLFHNKFFLPFYDREPNTHLTRDKNYS